MMLRGLELLTDEPGVNDTAQQVFATLSGRDSRAFPAEDYVRAKQVEMVEAGRARRLRAAGGIGEAVYAVGVARAGDYRLRLRLAGEAPAEAEISKAGEDAVFRRFTVAATPAVAWVDAGVVHLDQGAYDATVLLPEGGSLEYLELAPPCVQPIEPQGGWKPSAVATTEDVAVTVLQALDLESELPPSAGAARVPRQRPAARGGRTGAGDGLRRLPRRPAGRPRPPAGRHPRDRPLHAVLLRRARRRPALADGRLPFLHHLPLTQPHARLARDPLGCPPERAARLRRDARARHAHRAPPARAEEGRARRLRRDRRTPGPRARSRRPCHAPEGRGRPPLPGAAPRAAERRALRRHPPARDTRGRAGRVGSDFERRWPRRLGQAVSRAAVSRAAVSPVAAGPCLRRSSRPCRRRARRCRPGSKGTELPLDGADQAVGRRWALDTARVTHRDAPAIGAEPGDRKLQRRRGDVAREQDIVVALERQQLDVM